MIDRYAVFLALLIMLCMLSGLIFAWAWLGRRHWLVRVFVVEGYLALWLLPEAYEILAVAATQLGTMVVCFAIGTVCAWLSAWRRGVAWNGAKGKQRFQFSLRDLLLAAVPLGIASAIASHVFRATSGENVAIWTAWETRLGTLQPWQWVSLLPAALGQVGPQLPEPWIVFLQVGFVSGVSTALAAWGIFGRRETCRPKLRAVVLVLIPSTWPFALWFGLLRVSGLWRVEHGRTTSSGEAPGEQIATEDVVVSPNARRRVLRLAAKIAGVLLSAGIVVPLVVLFWAMANPPAIPDQQLPDPNGYTTLLEAANAFAATGIADPTAVPLSQLKAFVTEHEDLLATVRASLDQECVVPLNYESTDSMMVGAGMRPGARALVAFGMFAESEGKIDEAVDIYFDVVRMGKAMTNGGLVIDRLVGIAVFGMGMGPMYHLQARLSVEQRLTVIDKLLDVSTPWEPLEDCLQRDHDWCSITFGWPTRLQHRLAELLPNIEWDVSFLGSTDTMMAAIELRREAIPRLLACTLALKNYKSAHGKYPDSLDALTSAHFGSRAGGLDVPSTFVYRPEGNTFALYDVGPNGTDDGGEILGVNDSDDINLDKWFSPGATSGNTTGTEEDVEEQEEG